MSEDIAIAPDSVVTGTLWSRLYGSEVRNTFAFKNIFSEDVDLLASFAPLFADQFMPSLQGLSTAQLNYYNMRLDVWDPVGMAFSSVGWRDYPLDLFGAFAAGGVSLPANNSLVMRRRVGPAGRANRGRMYVAGVPAAATTGQIPGGTYLDAINVFKVQWARSLRTEGGVPLFTPELPKYGPTGLLVSTQLVSFWDHNVLVRSQRRRERDVGI